MIDKNELKCLFKKLDKKFNDKESTSRNECFVKIDIGETEDCPRCKQ